MAAEATNERADRARDAGPPASQMAGKRRNALLTGGKKIAPKPTGVKWVNIKEG